MASLIPAAIQIGGAILASRSKGKEAEGIEAGGAAARAQLEPFIAPGVEATQTIQNALGGGQGALDAFRQFQQSTGFQEQLRAGSEAIVGNQATRGLLGSGSTLKRQTKFGQDLAAGGFQNFLANLSGQAQRGITAAVPSAGVAQTTATAAAGRRSAGAEAFQSGVGAATQTEGFQNFLSGLGGGGSNAIPVGGA